MLIEHFPIERDKKEGRPRMHPLKMFKILLLQKMYVLSDQAAEFQIADQMTFQRFLGITSIKSIPHEKTIWLFREEIKEKGLIDQLFNLFRNSLVEKGLIVNDGKIVAASIGHAPKQHNTREETNQVKEGKTPEARLEKPNKPR